MVRQAAKAGYGRFWRWLTLGGRVSPVQPWALALGPGTLLLATLAPSRWLLFIAYAFLLLTLAAYAWVRVVGPRVRLHRRLLVDWAQVGDDLAEEWELANESWLPLLWLEIDDASTLPGYAGRRIAAAGPYERQNWTTAARCERRGVYRLGPLGARLGDPFGLFQFAWREGEARQIVVYPPLVRLPPLPLPHGQRGGLARADVLQQYATPSVGGLREYVPGDSPSHIHWPTVARTDRLMVKEFDQERAGALWIVLDLCAAAYPAATAGAPVVPAADDPLREYTRHSAVSERPDVSRPESLPDLAIVLACSLAAQALAEGRVVGLLADDGQRRLVQPGSGPRQLWRILNDLVGAEATGARPLGEVIRETRWARGADLAGEALVVVTPALDGAWLPALARQRGTGAVLALLVGRHAAEARPLEARLASQSVPARTFVLGTALPLLHPPRRRVAVRVSPLGKVVRSV
jgi:uncharacterized protein (DUF58 family)